MIPLFLLVAATEVRVSNADELRAAFAAAKPGTRIVAAGGAYERVQAANVRGTKDSPVVLIAAGAKSPPVIRGMQLSDVEHVEIVGVHVVGAPTNGINVDDGGTFDTPSRFVVLRDVVVRDCGARGNEDGIKLSGVDDFRLENCTVERWGRGGSAVDMVGCRRGVIEACTFRDRADDPAATGVQTKGGTRDVVIRSSRFEHAGTRAVNVGGSTALAYFRPKPEAFEAKDITVEGCTFVGSEAPLAFVGVDGAVARFNTFVRPTKWFLRILQETREAGFVACRDVRYEDNLIVWSAREIATPVNVGSGTAPETFRFARNWWYCVDAPERSIPKLPTAETDGKGGADPRFRDPARGDYALADDSPARRHGASAFERTTR